MKVDTLRKIDRMLGIAICFALSMFRRIFSSNSRHPSVRPQRILILQLSEMGSLALAYPAVQRLMALFPDAEVGFLLFRRNRSFLEMLDLVNPGNIWELDDSSPLAFLRTAWRFFRKAREHTVDAVLDFEIFSRATAILSFLSGASRRAGFSNYRAEGLYRGNLLTHPVYYNPYQHISLNFIAMVEAISRDSLEQPALKEVLTPRRSLPLDAGESASAPHALVLPKRQVSIQRCEAMRSRLQALYPALQAATPILLMSPFSGNLLPIRAWPPAHYAQLIRGLLRAQSEAIVVLIGLSEARDYCRPIMHSVQSPRLVDFIGGTRDIAEVVDLIAISSLFVTSDSGPPHFASLTATPTIVLFGPESPMLYGPLGDNVECVYLGMHCSPCVSAFNHRDTPCRRNRCMEEISPSLILRLALRKLEN